MSNASSVGSGGVLNTLTQAAPVISISTSNDNLKITVLNKYYFLTHTATFSCPSLPSMAITQETPPTKNQEPEEAQTTAITTINNN